MTPHTLAGRAIDRSALAEAVEMALTDVAALGKQGLMEPSSTLEVTAVRRVKWKPGRKLTAEIDVRSTADGLQIDRTIYWTWPRTALVVDPAETARDQQILQRRGDLAPFRSAVLHLGEGVGEVQPLDPSFPSLLSLLDPSRSSLGRFSLTGRPEAVRYRPRQRHVLRFPTMDGDVYAKLSSKAARGARVAAAVSNGGAILPLRPDGHVESAVLYAQAEGVPAASLDPSRRLDLMRGLAASLPGLAATSMDVLDLPVHTHDGELALVDRAGEHIRSLLPGPGGRLTRVLEGLGQIVLPPAAGFVHRDLKIDHLWWRRDGKIILGDFDSAGIGDPACDVGKLLADIWWWNGPDERSQTLAIFEQELTPSTDDVRRWRWWESMWTAKAVARRARILDEDFEDRVVETIEHALALLAEAQP